MNTNKTLGWSELHTPTGETPITYTPEAQADYEYENDLYI